MKFLGTKLEQVGVNVLQTAAGESQTMQCNNTSVIHKPALRIL